jgi:hypothetical protein
VRSPAFSQPSGHVGACNNEASVSRLGCEFISLPGARALQSVACPYWETAEYVTGNGTVLGKMATHTRGLRFVRPSGPVGLCIAQGAPRLAAVLAPGQRRLAPRDAAHDRALRLTRHDGERDGGSVMAGSRASSTRRSCEYVTGNGRYVGQRLQLYTHAWTGGCEYNRVRPSPAPPWPPLNMFL